MPLSEGTEVRVIDDSHPHSGAIGLLEGNEQSIQVAGTRLLMICFHQSHHGKRGCYVSSEQVQPTT